MKRTIWFAALALASPAALAPAPASAQSAAHSPQALELVAMISPADMLTRVAQSAFDSMVAARADSGPMAADFKAHPGMKAYVAGRLRDRMTQLLSAEIPDLRDQIASLIERELTANEIVEVNTFFKTPTGMRLRKMTFEALIANPPMPGHEEESTQAAVTEFMKTLQPEDYPPLVAFGSSSGAAKMKTVNPEIAELSQRWAADLMAAHDKEFKDLAQTARTEFLAK